MALSFPAGWLLCAFIRYQWTGCSVLCGIFSVQDSFYQFDTAQMNR